MEVILVKPIKKLGKIGNLVKVKNGFGRNWLIPQGLAIRATEKNKQLIETQRTFVINSNAIADLGFGVGEFSGIPIIDDPHVPVYTVNGKPASSMYFINTRDVNFYSVPTRNAVTQGGAGGSIYTQMEQLSKTGLYVSKIVVGTICQMVLRSRKNCGKIINIAI
jgi:hypothetical protein